VRRNTEISKYPVYLRNTVSESELHKYFGMYGEIRNARTLAQNVVRARVQKSIDTIDQFKEVVLESAPRGRENKYLAQVFQALRIVVNAEIEALSEMLEATAGVLNPEGRLVVMSYHSLEDRLVKNLINKGNVGGNLEKDFYGNPIRPFDPVTRKPVMASDSEIADNPRARSAKLRIARRLDG
jgi:16S rRNA (cytosine1402-N4)-methyltransferase